MAPTADVNANGRFGGISSENIVEAGLPTEPHDCKGLGPRAGTNNVWTTNLLDAT
ncbi:MAG: hypothetical protein RMJ98_21755 [Myxococcales bacterium]|nr:hypothetical protein [Myxococcales bacterium]